MRKNPDIRQITESIRRGEIDCNNQSRFLSIVSKGLLYEMNNNISIRGGQVPHYILNTGSELMTLENKGQDHSKEPGEVTNENYIYTTTPRCAVTPKGVNILTDELTNPYAQGTFQYEADDNIISYVAEFRRIPMELSYEMSYLVDSYSDFLELVQQIITKLAFVRIFNVVYMGQTIRCSYNIPDSFDGEHMIEFDEATTDDRRRKLTFDLSIETCLPIFNNRTVIPSDNYIVYPTSEIIGYGHGALGTDGPCEVLTELNINHKS